MKKSKLARLIAAICCFAMLLTACNSNQTPAGSGGDVSTMADSEKKVLTYAIGAETTDLSTLYMNNSLCCTSKLVYENLVDFDNGEIVPGLAESWEYNDDQKMCIRDSYFCIGNPVFYLAFPAREYVAVHLFDDGGICVPGI